jgi:hypothetical protein
MIGAQPDDNPAGSDCASPIRGSRQHQQHRQRERQKAQTLPIPAFDQQLPDRAQQVRRPDLLIDHLGAQGADQ